MIDKKIDDIVLDDIEQLIANSVQESKTLEYKSELCMGNNDEKKELLADISSFANSIGGDLIIGITEDENTKIPVKICGISYPTEDELVRRVESFIRDSIQPRILNIRFKVVPIQDGKCVLIMRIPQSLFAPHRIEFHEYHKFFNRNNKGKYPMDINEIRIAFNSGLDLNKRIDSFKTDRYYDILSNKYDKLNNNKPIFIVHYIPVSAFNRSLQLFSAKEIKQSISASNSNAFGNTSFSSITVDGVLIPHTQYDDSFAFFKNNGIIEKASTKYFDKDYVITSIVPNIHCDNINISAIHENLIADFNQTKNYYTSIGIVPPIVISCAFLNAANYTIPSMRTFQHILGKIDREILCTNDVYVEDFSESTENILKPIFNSIWNACGYEESPYYNKE